MKKWLLKLLVVVLVAVLGPAAVAQEADAAKVGLRLWLIFDSSSNCRGQWSELQSIAKAAVQALEPGDRVRVEAATIAEPRLVALEQLPAGDAVRKEILRAITELQSEDDTETVAVPRRSFVNKLLGQEGRTEFESRPRNVQADVIKALGVPLSVVKAEHSRETGRDLVVLLTCARWSDEVTEQCLAVYEELKAHGVTLIITGANDANRRLVLAATRGLLNWHEIVYCTPDAWLMESRKRAKSSPASTPKPENPGAQGLGTIPLRSDAGKAMIAVPSPSSLPVKETSKTAPVPTASEGSPSQPKRIIEFNISVTTPEDKSAGAATVSASRASSLPQGSTAPIQVKVPLSPAQPQPVISSAIQEPEKTPASETPGAPETPVIPAATEPAPSPPTWVGRWAYRLIGALVALFLIILGGLAFRDMRRARRATRPAAAATETNQHPSEVVARFNGAERVLGRPEALQHFHVGSGASNALRISETGVEEQHVLFRRDRLGIWSARNLSSKPLDANGTPVNPGKTIEVDFPVAVRLTDHVCFNLFTRPVSHGQESSEASEPNTIRSATSG